MPAARTATTTSPGPGDGSGCSRSGISPGPSKTRALILERWPPPVATAGQDERGPQPLRGDLCRQVALRLRQEFVADHELADVGGQERREEVGVELPVLLRRRRGTAPDASPSSTETTAPNRRSYDPSSRDQVPGQRVARAGRRGPAGAPPAASRSAASRTARRPRTGRRRANRRPRPRPAARRPPGRRSRAAAAGPCSPRYARWVASSRAASCGSAEPAQIWPCGWGFDAPIISPRFSKTWTHWKRSPSSAVWSAQRSMTPRTSGRSMRASVRSWRREKHRTRHVPASTSARSRPSSRRSAGASGRSAA